jgi:hypothetical protein
LQADLDGDRFIEDLRRTVERSIAFDAILRVRTSTGVNPLFIDLFIFFYFYFFLANVVMLTGTVEGSIIQSALGDTWLNVKRLLKMQVHLHAHFLCG